MASWCNIANTLSLLRIFITPLLVWILLYKSDYILTAITLFSLAAFTDTCDGYLARRYRLTTELGNFLDPLADKVLTFSTFIAFYIKGFLPLWFVVLVITRDSGITLLRCINVNKGKSLKTSNLGKLKMIFQVILIYVVFVTMFFKHYYALGEAFLPLLVGLTYITAFLTVYSGVTYVLGGSR